MPATAICSLSRNFWKLVYDMPTTTAPHPLTVVSCVCSSCSSSVLSISNSAALARHRPLTSKTGGCASFQSGMHKFSFRRSIPSPLSHYAELWLADDCSKTPSFSTPPREASVPLFLASASCSNESTRWTSSFRWKVRSTFCRRIRHHLPMDSLHVDRRECLYADDQAPLLQKREREAFG